MDAFGTAHRAQASTHGVAKYAPVACAGPLLARELDALEKALAHSGPPVAAIVGGSKVSTKLLVLETLSDKVDQLDCWRRHCQYLSSRGRQAGGQITLSSQTLSPLRRR